MVNLFDSVLVLQETGFFDVFLPFLLIFAISFGVLEKIKLFGAHGRGANFIISVVMGLLFLQNTFLINKMHLFLTNASIALVGVIIFLVFLGAFIGEQSTWTKAATNLALVASIVLVFWSLSYNPFDDEFVDDPGFLRLWWEDLPAEWQGIILFAAGIAIIYFVFIKGGKKDGWARDLLKDIGEGIKGN